MPETNTMFSRAQPELGQEALDGGEDRRSHRSRGTSGPPGRTVKSFAVCGASVVGTAVQAPIGGQPQVGDGWARAVVMR